MTIEQLEGIANVQYATTTTDVLIAGTSDWKSGTLTRTNADVVADTLRMGWGDTALSPVLHSRYDNTGGQPQDVSANNISPNDYNLLSTGQSLRGRSRYEWGGQVDNSQSSTSYINWGDNAAFEFGGTSFTIEVWYYVDTSIRSLSTDGNSSLHSKTHANPVSTETTPWYLSRVGNTNKATSGEVVEAEAYFRDGNNNDYNQNQTSTTTDQWRHHAIVYDQPNTQAYVYLDGTEQFNFNVPDDPWGSHGDVLVVGSHSGAAFPGSMANFRIVKSKLGTSDFDYGTTGTADGYSLTYGSERNWQQLDFASVSIPAGVDGVTCDLESLTGGTSQDTLSVSLSDATTSYDISTLANGEEIQADFTIDVLNEPTATPEIKAPVEVTSS